MDSRGVTIGPAIDGRGNQAANFLRAGSTVLLLILALLAGLWPDAANAGRVTASTFPSVGFRFDDEGTEENDLTISFAPDSSSLVVTDANNNLTTQDVPGLPGSGTCTVDGNSAVCPVPPGTIKEFSIYLGQGDDRLTVDLPVRIAELYVSGGAGSDHIDLSRVSLDETGRGNIDADPNWQPQPGIDPDTGKPYPPQDLSQDGDDFVASVQEGPAGDVRVYGGLGSDRLVGGSGGVILVGDPDGPDPDGYDLREVMLQQQVEFGDDVLIGGDGPDLLIGSGGADFMSGGAGDDRLRGEVYWPPQDDGSPDSFACGAGKDSVTMFEDDQTTPDCESITRFVSCPALYSSDCVFTTEASTQPLVVAPSNASDETAGGRESATRRKVIRLTNRVKVVAPPGKRRRVVLNLIRRRANLALRNRGRVRAKFAQRRQVGRSPVKLKRTRFYLKRARR